MDNPPGTINQQRHLDVILVEVFGHQRILILDLRTSSLSWFFSQLLASLASKTIAWLCRSFGFSKDASDLVEVLTLFAVNGWITAFRLPLGRHSTWYKAYKFVVHCLCAALFLQVVEGAAEDIFGLPSTWYE